MTLTEAMNINGGELPYTENALKGRSMANQIMYAAHQAGDFIRGFLSGF
ncbi:hypothetical protein KRE40_16350 [Elizabethkingia meningoseptica]|nr:hypothetical protein [Elizabethkingia meningoseptica]MDE5439538.1 hypothetical protein [Elizabethkingia meningoseptica]MDE5510207.1 hypothetical protein [Elizabethkingia meningoseptica]